MNILMTGATGFVGRRLAESLRQNHSFDLTSAVRQPEATVRGRAIAIGEIDGSTDWSVALNDQQLVIHTAARAHIMKDEVADPLAEYRKVNVEGTLNLARQAARAGIKRFIFISSIKVNGEQTRPGESFSADDILAPADTYGISKMEAEQGLQQLAQETDMEVVIIRPPLVYGPSVKGNFAAMIRMIQRGWPLPLGSIQNKRSLVALDNLADLIVTCIDHPAAANQVFLAGDGDDLSTTELLRGVANAMGKPLRLVPVPAGLLRFGAMLLGRQAMAERLLGSLQVDISKTHDLLGWEPPLTVAAGLKRCFIVEQNL